MKLVEIMVHCDTDESLIAPMGVLENVLGKGVVYAKDTPNFTKQNWSVWYDGYIGRSI